MPIRPKITKQSNCKSLIFGGVDAYQGLPLRSLGDSKIFEHLLAHFNAHNVIEV